ncbi:MAG: SCP2 sterol-binding domain-containing protein [Myxococcota bacterium]
MTRTEDDLEEPGLSSPEGLAARIEGLGDADIEADIIRIGVDRALGQVFETMAGRFLPDRAAGEQAVIEWDLQGPDGSCPHHLTIDGGRCAHAKGRATAPRVTLQASIPTFLRIVAGRLSGLQAFSTGALQVTGDRVLALRQQLWFDVDLSQAEIRISTPSELARLLDGRSDDEIEAGVALNGIDRTLEKVFQGMVDHFLPRRAGRKPAAIEFRIRSTQGDRTYQFVAARGGARYHAGQVERPNVKIHVAFPDFLRMIAGRLHGIKAFAQGKIKVRGNLLLARKIEGWFDRSR